MPIKIINKLKSKLANGITINIGCYKVNVNINKSKPQEQDTKFLSMMFRQAKFLENKYPDLKKLNLTVTLNNVDEIFDFYCAYIPLLDNHSHETYLRVILHKLALTTKDTGLKEEIKKEIAKSDLRSAIPHRAQILVSDEYLHKELYAQTHAAESEYGANIITENWSGTGRGESLILFFENNMNILQGKSILHISPEPILSKWIEKNNEKLNIEYVTSNIGGSKNVDEHYDLTNIDVENDKFDLIICHRVLEHVLDDMSAIKEMFRVLKSGGLLQVSVPESLHVETNDWIIPDTTHHCHVRHYGKDFLDRLADAGFSVQLENWFFSKTRSELLDNNAYPLRMYNAIKGE